MGVHATPYESNTFGNSLSLRVDGGVGAVSINPSGRDVVLAGHRGLYVVDLDDPFSPPRWLQHLTSWEVADVQWSPHASKPAWVISTSNQKAMLWNLSRTGTDAIEHILHGHSRAITDINFHPDHPELLATCSVDTSVLAWDMRIPKKPTYKMLDYRAGASQVKWNFKNSNILATSHDNYVYIWDLRNDNKPMLKIEAHDRKINGIDFSRTTENEIVTSSNDYTVKFWDISKDIDTPKSTIKTDFPVWRARHLPFGSGCAIMPLRGGQNAIYLASTKSLEGDTKLQSSYIFKGHSDRVTDFLWRSRNTHSGVDDREFQLVTWSKDCDLRLWSLNEEIYEKLDFERGKPAKFPEYSYETYREEPGSVSENQILLKKTKDSFVSSRGETVNTADHLNWLSGVRIGRSAFASPIDQNPNQIIDNSPGNLGEEVSIIGHKFPKVRFEKISVSTGTLVLSLNGPWAKSPDDLLFLRVEIKVPKGYPENSPSFRIEENRELDEDNRQEILINLQMIVKAYAEVSRYSLESCLRFLMGEKIDLTNLRNTDHEEDFQLDAFDDISSLNSTNNSTESEVESEADDELIPLAISQVSTEKTFDSTPIPKGCGASWTKTGQLVCFFIPKVEPKSQRVIKLDERGFSNQVMFDENYNSDDDSDDSLSDEWNAILSKDMTNRSKIPGLFRIQNQSNKKSLPSERSNNTTNTVNKNVVAIFDMKHLIPSKMELADEYEVIGESREQLALHNADICTKYGYTDLADSWRVLSSVFSDQFYWGTHPFGRLWFIKELMKYYEKMGNVQMLAMMSCVIEGPKKILQYSDPIVYEPLVIQRDFKDPKERAQSMSSSHDQYSDSYRLSFSRSSSVATKELERPIEVKIEMMNEGELGYKENEFSFTLLDGELNDLYNKYRDEYANILYNWGQTLRRAEILKFNHTIYVLREDDHAGKVEWRPKADKDCSYCGLKVKRRLFACYQCEHVLHADCASIWFKISNECASGCGCNCLKDYRNTL